MYIFRIHKGFRISKLRSGHLTLGCCFVVDNVQAWFLKFQQNKETIRKKLLAQENKSSIKIKE